MSTSAFTLLRRSLRFPLSSAFRPKTSLVQRRTLIPAPKPNSGPLLTRRADRELPTLANINRFRRQLIQTFPLFIVVVGAAGFALFNYQNANSSVVSSSLYALRMNPTARRLLGNEIYFAERFPWIWGTIDSLHGIVDVEFKVKGTAGSGSMRFKCVKPTREQFFETVHWELITSDGHTYNLMNPDAPDPMIRSDLPTAENPGLLEKLRAENVGK